MHNLFAFIQARTASSRLPGKILKQIPQENGLAAIEHIVHRLNDVLEKGRIVILIPDGDAELIKFCNHHSWQFLEGSEEDVRERFIKAAKKYSAEGIIRLTADNPFIDVEHIELLIEAWCQSKPDLVSFRDLPIGLGVEIFSTNALLSGPEGGLLSRHREHVSLHIKEFPDKYKIFKLASLLSNEEITHAKKLRLTMDEEADYQLLCSVYLQLGKENDFGVRDIIELYKKNAALFTINQQVDQVKFNLPSLKPELKNKFFILYAPVEKYGSGHYERAKIIFIFLQLKNFECMIANRLNDMMYDVYIIDHRDLALPESIDKKKALLLDNLGSDRNKCQHADFLFSNSYTISECLLSCQIENLRNDTLRNKILIYAGNLNKEETVIIDSFLKKVVLELETSESISKVKIVRIGGASSEESFIQYFPRVGKSQFYQLLAEAEIFISYPGVSIQEAIYLNKKILLFSFSEIHKAIGKSIAELTGLNYIGDTREGNLMFPGRKNIAVSRLNLPNNGLEVLLKKLECMLN